MRHTILLWGLLQVAGLTCDAQALSGPSSNNRVFTHADTVQALHALFRRGRTWGKVGTVLAPVSIALVAYAGSKMELGGYDVISGGSTDPNSYAYGAMLGAPVAITLSLLGPFSWAANSKYTEQQTIQAYEQHQPLSKRTQRRLHNQLERLILDGNTLNR
ncbi:hypothetical protein GCM10022409_16870 [Hymenobacter glaciei]|uniref:Uncharacterized protein n=1 Tax=Hymenobacter glaciei TaxID=877209 RepID=A0ABP7U0K5_9BACT